MVAFRLTPAAAISFLLGASFFCWAHLTVVRTVFPGSPADHTIALYPTEILALAAIALGWWRRRGGDRPRAGGLRGLAVAGGALWLAAAVAGSLHARDPVLAAAWTLSLAVALGCLSAPLDKRALVAGLALGVAASLPAMLIQAARQTTWPAAAINGWSGGELTGAVRGAAVLGSRRWLRPYGLTPHPNIAGGLAAIACVLLAAAWLRHGGRWQLAMAAAGFGEALLSFSRSAWIGMLLGIVLLVSMYRGRTRSLLLALALPAVLFGAALGPLVPRRTEAAGPLEANSLSQRVYLARAALDFWSGRPLLGIGPAQFGQWEVDRYGAGFIPEPAHNAALLILAETGVLGLAGAGRVGV
ncbi:MAG: O-antigen ligase family protein, partial [Chloroflexota bacterium]